MSKSIGAIIGDIAGSIYEFDNHRSKDFPFFGDGVEFTDDSIMTIATMEALMNGGSHDDFVDAYKRLGNKYPSSYGLRFSDWLASDNPKPYDSWGNGSAMRVSPVAWFYGNLEEVVRVAKISAEVTHNHPEGIKGAQSTAAAVFLARTGKGKPYIKEYLERQYGYFLDFKLDDIRDTYKFDESSTGTVPPAIVAFLESTDFEDAIRNAISIGGDSDTLAAITGSIAEAFYGIDLDMQGKGLYLLSDDLRKIVFNFNTRIVAILAVHRFRSLSNVDKKALRALNARIQSHTGDWGGLAQEFVQFMYDKDLVVNFDWPKWQAGRDWYALQDASKYDKLDIEMSLKLLTTIIRNDRFNEGALVRAFEDGTFCKVTKYLIDSKKTNFNTFVSPDIIGFND